MYLESMLFIVGFDGLVIREEKFDNFTEQQMKSLSENEVILELYPEENILPYLEQLSDKVTHLGKLCRIVKVREVYILEDNHKELSVYIDDKVGHGRMMSKLMDIRDLTLGDILIVTNEDEDKISETLVENSTYDINLVKYDTFTLVSYIERWLVGHSSYVDSFHTIIIDGTQLNDVGIDRLMLLAERRSLGGLTIYVIRDSKTCTVYHNNENTHITSDVYGAINKLLIKSQRK